MKSLVSPCSPRVIFNTKEACPVLSFRTFWEFLERYYILLGCLMVLIGGFLAFAGGRFYKATMFMAAQFGFAITLLMFLYIKVIPTHCPEWVVWLSLMVTLGIGAGIGYAAAAWARIGVLIISVWVGGVIGAILYNTFIYLMASKNPLLVLWLSIAAMAIMIGVLSMIFFDHAVIFGSSIIGSYIFIRVNFSCTYFGL